MNDKGWSLWMPVIRARSCSAYKTKKIHLWHCGDGMHSSSTSEAITLSEFCNPGRIQSISRMDGVPQVSRQRSLRGKHSRLRIIFVLKEVFYYASWVYHEFLIQRKSLQKIFDNLRNALLNKIVQQ